MDVVTPLLSWLLPLLGVSQECVSIVELRGPWPVLQLALASSAVESQCIKQSLAKATGLGIVVGSSLVKLPQLLTLVRSQSATGLSLVGTLLELVALTFAGCYALSLGVPFSAYGESFFLAIQTSLIAFLVLWFGRQQARALIFSLVYAMLVSALVSDSEMVRPVLWWGQAANIPLVILGKLVQVVTNFGNGHTGQMSAITTFLMALGALARIFTSVQETGDSLIILTYVCSTAVNSILAAQILFYWKATKNILEKEARESNRKKK